MKQSDPADFRQQCEVRLRDCDKLFEVRVKDVCLHAPSLRIAHQFQVILVFADCHGRAAMRRPLHLMLAAGLRIPAAPQQGDA